MASDVMCVRKGRREGAQVNGSRVQKQSAKGRKLGSGSGLDARRPGGVLRLAERRDALVVPPEKGKPSLA
jgi:hypothetical protein